MVTNSNDMGAGIKNPRLLSIVNAFPNRFAEYIFVILFVGDFECVVLIPAIGVPTWRDSLF